MAILLKSLTALFRAVGVGGFPPFRQKKCERMGHGAGTETIRNVLKRHRESLDPLTAASLFSMLPGRQRGEM